MKAKTKFIVIIYFIIIISCALYAPLSVRLFYQYIFMASVGFIAGYYFKTLLSWLKSNDL